MWISTPSNLMRVPTRTQIINTNRLDSSQSNVIHAVTLKFRWKITILLYFCSFTIYQSYFGIPDSQQYLRKFSKLTMWWQFGMCVAAVSARQWHGDSGYMSMCGPSFSIALLLPFPFVTKIFKFSQIYICDEFIRITIDPNGLFQVHVRFRSVTVFSFSNRIMFESGPKGEFTVSTGHSPGYIFFLLLVTSQASFI